MVKLKKGVVVLLCILSLFSNALFRPVRVDAVAVVAVPAAGLIKSLVASLAVTYIGYEGLTHVNDSYDSYIAGTGAEKIQELEEQQITLYRDNTGQEPPEDEDGNPIFTSLKVTGEILEMARGFYAELFAEKETVEAATDIGRYYNFSLSPMMNKVMFGGHPSYDKIDTLFANCGYNFKSGGITSLNSNSDGQSYVSYKRFLDYMPANYIPEVNLQHYSNYADEEHLKISLYITDISQDIGFDEEYTDTITGNVIYDHVYEISQNYMGECSFAWYTSSGKIYTEDTGVTWTSSYYDYPDTSEFGLYVDVAPCFVVDYSTGYRYLWDGEKLVIRDYTSTTEYIDIGVDRPYIHTSDGYYDTIGDVYTDTDELSLINERIDNLQNYIDLNSTDGTADISVDDLTSLQTDIQNLQNTLISDYPMQQPETVEVPSEFPLEMDNVYQSYINTSSDTGTDSGTDTGTDTGTDPGTNPGTDTGTDTGTDPGTDPGTDTGTDTGTDDESLPSLGDLPKEDYALDLMDFFPFCIPNDLYMIIKGLDAEPVAPCFKLTLPTSKGNSVEDHYFEIDLSSLDSVAVVIRTMEKIGFVVVLIVISRKIVKGG